MLNPLGLKKNRGQPLYPYASVSVSIGFFSSASVCSVLAALARKSRLFRTSVVCEVHSATQPQLEIATFSTSVVHKVHFGSSSWKVATFQ